MAFTALLLFGVIPHLGSSACVHNNSKLQLKILSMGFDSDISRVNYCFSFDYAVTEKQQFLMKKTTGRKVC